MSPQPNLPHPNAAKPQLEGDAIPGLTPARKAGLSAKAIAALAIAAVSVGAVSVVVVKRFAEGRSSTQAPKTPEVASAHAQRLRLGEPKTGTVPTQASAPLPGAASAPAPGTPALAAGAGATRVPAIAESGAAEPIEVVRNGAPRSGGPAGPGTAHPAGTAQPIHPMDAPVFAGRGPGQAAARPAAGGAGRAAPVDEESREQSLARTMAELREHKQRLQAELDRRLGQNPQTAGSLPKPGAPTPADRARGAIDAMASRLGSPIYPDRSASQPTTGLLGGGMDHSATARVSAQRPFDRSLTIAKGAIFQCALQSRVVTATSGFVNCLVQRDVFGHDGRIVLVERGSTLVGEYRMVAVRPGLTRIPVVWTRLLTPAAVSVDLESPAVGALGESGIGGYVDNRWPERIGAALLVSLVDDALQLASQRQDAEGNTVYLPSTTNQGSKLAEEVMKSTIHIPPLLYQNQGGVVGVFVARDLDFTSVYRLVAQ